MPLVARVFTWFDRVSRGDSDLVVRDDLAAFDFKYRRLITRVVPTDGIRLAGCIDRRLVRVQRQNLQLGNLPQRVAASADGSVALTAGFFGLNNRNLAADLLLLLLLQNHVERAQHLLGTRCVFGADVLSQLLGYGSGLDGRLKETLSGHLAL